MSDGKDAGSRFDWLPSRMKTSEKPRKTKVSRAPLKLGNRFAQQEITGLEETKADRTDKSVESLINTPTLPPEIWKLFEGEAVQQTNLKPADRIAELKARLDRPGRPPNSPAAGRTLTTTIEILLVEDNPGHVRLMQEALEEASAKFHMSVVEDGAEALEFLRHQGKYEAVTRPDLILLDLNLPKKDGREVLAEIKTDTTLGSIPVVVLTASADEDDIRMSYGLQANCFITKPANLSEFANVVKMIESFWGRFVSLP